ncbi:MAG: hypothetical protein KDK36_10640 [Leptospiraceae bacterium]|nr:hypothetical protein [Leptospiraceae bacterium]
MIKSEKTIQIIKSLQLQCDISGKIDGLSFYKWKGKNVVRKIGKPSKPASEAQLECRRKFATLQNLSKIFKPIIRETYNTGKKPLTPANLFIKKNGELFEKVEKSINPIDTEKTVMLRLSKHEPISKKSWFDKAHHDNSRSEWVTDTEKCIHPIPKGLLDIKFISYKNKFHNSASSPQRSKTVLPNIDKIRSSSALPQSGSINLKQKSPSWVYQDADDDNIPDYSKLQLTRSNYPIPFTPKLTKHSEELFTLQWDDFTKRYDTIVLLIFSPEKEKYDKIEINITKNYWHIEIPKKFQGTKNYYYLYSYHSKRKTYSESITLTPEDGVDILWKIRKQKLSLTVGFNPWSITEEQDNDTKRLRILYPFRREMLRFSLWFPLGCLLPTFDIRFYLFYIPLYNSINFSLGTLPFSSLE